MKCYYYACSEHTINQDDCRILKIHLTYQSLNFRTELVNAKITLELSIEDRNSSGQRDEEADVWRETRHTSSIQLKRRYLHTTLESTWVLHTATRDPLNFYSTPCEDVRSLFLGLRFPPATLQRGFQIDGALQLAFGWLF